jgi:hypothetical protein
MAMVTGDDPHLNVIVPPVVTAALSALKVQLAAVPVPTTVVGVEVSTGVPAVGTPALQEPSGLPGVTVPLLEELELPVDELVPPMLGELVPPLLDEPELLLDELEASPEALELTEASPELLVCELIDR